MENSDSQIEKKGKSSQTKLKYVYAKSSRTLANIKSAYFKWIKEHKCAPTFVDLAEELDMSVQQVKDHFTNIDFESEYKELFKGFTSEVMHSNLVEALKGNVAAMSLYYKYINGWQEKREFEDSPSQEVKPPQIIVINQIKNDSGN